MKTTMTFITLALMLMVGVNAQSITSTTSSSSNDNRVAPMLDWANTPITFNPKIFSREVYSASCREAARQKRVGLHTKNYRINPMFENEFGVRVCQLEKKVERTKFVDCGKKVKRNINGARVNVYLGQCEKRYHVWVPVSA